MSGRDWLDAIVAGERPPPPAVALIGFDLVHVGDGCTTFRFVPDERHLNPLGSVHGGVLSTVADTALTTAVASRLDGDGMSTTVDLHVSFIRPVTIATGPLTCEARAVHIGGTLAYARAEMVDGAGSLYLQASATLRILTVLRA